MLPFRFVLFRESAALHCNSALSVTELVGYGGVLQPPVEWFRRGAASVLYVACVCRTGLVKSSRYSQS